MLPITRVELRRVSLPLRRPFRSAHGVVAQRDVLLVRVERGGQEGWGECAAPSEAGYTAEHVEGAHRALREALVPLVLGPSSVSAADLPSLLAPVPGHPMAKAALEVAVLDAELRAAAVPLAHHLGATRTWVEAGVALGVPASVGELLEEVAAALDEGYRRVKLKIGPGWDVAPVRAVRERFGNDVVLQVDANGAYGLLDAEHLSQLDAFGLALIEQPLPAADLAGHAELARRIATPVCLDESVTSAATAAEAISMGAAAVVNLKPGRLGGLAEAARAHDVCRAAGVPVWCGGMLETGIGRAANVSLAALPGFTLPGDLTPPEHYLAADVAEPLVRDGAMVQVPTGPGASGAIMADALEAATTSVELLR